MKPPRESRIRTHILTGEGPNGEDVVQFIDSTTGDIIKEEIRSPEARTVVRESPEGEPVIEVVPPKAVRLSAQEMTRLAIREREQTLGKRVSELMNAIMEECRKVILDGACTYHINAEDNVPGEVVKKTVSDLKGLGYKVKVVPDPGGLTAITVKWPVKEDKKPSKKKAEPVKAVVVEEAPKPAVQPKVKTPRKKPLNPEPEVTQEVPVPSTAAVDETPTLDFKGMKPKPAGWRPERRKPTRTPEASAIPGTRPNQ